MENEVNIDLGQVEPIKGQDYYTEEVNAFEDDVAATIKNNLDQTYQTTANKTNELSESSTSNQYPNAELVYNEFNKRNKQLDYVDICNKGFRDGIPTGTEEGEVVNLQECSNLPLKDFKLKGNQNGIVTGDVTVKVLGKNLFDKNNVILNKRLASDGEASVADNSYCTTNYFMRAKPNTTYYSTQTISQSRAVCFYDENKNFIERQVYLSKHYFTSPANAAYMKISLLKDTGSQNEGTYEDEQVEIGSTATTYKPYTAKTQLLSLGDIQLAPTDEIAKVNNEWCVNDTPITDTTLKGQLDNVMQIPMNKGTTNIFITTANDNPILETTYYKDLGTLVYDIDTRLELLET